MMKHAPSFYITLVLFIQTPGIVMGQNSQLDATAKLMKELTEAHGPTGSEEPVGKIVARHLQPLVSDIKVDGLGSIIGTKKGSSDSPRIMLAAHMDEVGFIVKTISPDGFIYTNPVGGWRDPVLLAQRWVIMTRKGPVVAVSGAKTTHVMSAEAKNRPVPQQDVFWDVGARTREEAMETLGIQPGDPVAPESPFQVMANGEFYMEGLGRPRGPRSDHRSVEASAGTKASQHDHGGGDDSRGDRSARCAHEHRIGRTRPGNLTRSWSGLRLSGNQSQGSAGSSGERSGHFPPG